MGKRKEAQASQQLQDFAVRTPALPSSRACSTPLREPFVQASVSQVQQHLNEVLSEATPEKLGQVVCSSRQPVMVHA